MRTWHTLTNIAIAIAVIIGIALLLTGCIVVPVPAADHASRPYYYGPRY